jgi:hypothetical protein
MDADGRLDQAARQVFLVLRIGFGSLALSRLALAAYPAQHPAAGASARASSPAAIRG